MEHPPYSPNLMHSEFHFCGHLKKHLAGEKYCILIFFYAGIQASKRWWENAEISVATLWKPNVYQSLLMHHQESSSQHHSVC